jgi:16S rRNA C967 or C1407 C5-methylase (RsmB/RsmF family)
MGGQIVEESYRKDLSHITWDEVFARQVRRAGLVEEWMGALQLQPGSRVLDIGAGPGYVSLVLADRVGPDGLVYAVDRSAEALAYLKRLQNERGVSHKAHVAGPSHGQTSERPQIQSLLYSAPHSPSVKSGRRHNTLLPTSATRLYLRVYPSRDPCAKIT